MIDCEAYVYECKNPWLKEENACMSRIERYKGVSQLMTEAN